MAFAREREMRETVTAYLIDQGFFVRFETCCCNGNYCDVVGVQFGKRKGRRIPPIESSIAIELKLSDVAGVLNQCRINRPAVQVVCAAMPVERIEKMRPATINLFRKDGIGLIGVDYFSKEVRFFVHPVITEPTAVDWHMERFRKKMWRYFIDAKRQVAAELNNGNG